MTTSLKRAFKEASNLPPEVQEELAEQLMEDIRGELKWDETLASAKSQRLLERMSAETLKAMRQGKVRAMGFDEL